MRLIFFFKQKTAYELRISDWSSDVCASDLPRPCDQRGLINPPVDRASTIIYDSVEAYMDRHQGLYDEVIYGMYGTRTTFALAEAVSELEGGCNTVLTSSGTRAIALALKIGRASCRERVFQYVSILVVAVSFK